MVAVHGIHHLGMDEPRLVGFAKAVAGSGLAVLTPQVDSLADYHVDRDSIGIIGESAVWLGDRLGGAKVTVTGISFAGGLSLMAALDPRYASHLRALVLMGAYDDLARVSRFLATGIQELPDGTKEPHPAHDYGASVFVYAHLRQFFPPADLEAAHEALRDWLWERPDQARMAMEKLSPPARATMDALLDRRIDEVRPQILNAILADEAELAAISPHGRMDGLHVPVYILHGSADNIIPPAESLWLAKDIPRAEVRDVLITGAFSHVDPEKDASLKEELRLVKFVGGVLRAAN
jgi:pimeloyl-ACP methyl ester carboxylesterase